VSDDLRERALTAAKAEADQKEHERAEYEERVQQWKDQLLDAAQAECERVLGVRAEFSIWRVPHHDSGYTGEVAARADIEGINVTYRLRRDMDGNGYWGSLGSSGQMSWLPSSHTPTSGVVTTTSGNCRTTWRASARRCWRPRSVPGRLPSPRR
jgi:hypothetical protein